MALSRAWAAGASIASFHGNCRNSAMHHRGVKWRPNFIFHFEHRAATAGHVLVPEVEGPAVAQSAGGKTAHSMAKSGAQSAA
jgi:hypothetical protein